MGAFTQVFSRLDWQKRNGEEPRVRRFPQRQDDTQWMIAAGGYIGSRFRCPAVLCTRPTGCYSLPMGAHQEEQTPSHSYTRDTEELELSKSASSSREGYQFRYLPQLDGFRGLAVILVLAGHVVEFSTLSIYWRRVGEVSASLGVFLFFVLSGFLITSLLYAERRNTGSTRLRNFYIRRVLRLGPALLLFLSVIVILRSFGAITDIPRYEIFASLFYSRNFFGRSNSLAHLWSLSLEEQFYLCWPLVFSFTPLKKVFLVSVCATASIVIWRGLAIYFNFFDYGQGIYFVRPYFRFDSILIGACLAIALVSRPEFLSHARIASRRLSVALIWLVLILWTLFGESICKPLYLSIQMVVVALLLLQLVLAEGGWSLTFFSQPLLRYIGTISYSLYLWQQIFLVTKTPNWGVLRRFPLNLFISFALAILSYHFVEKPALRLKERFQFL